MGKGKHPVPSRTRKLSPSAPMVLQPRGCGRVGPRRTYFSQQGHPPPGMALLAFPDESTPHGRVRVPHVEPRRRSHAVAPMEPIRETLEALTELESSHHEGLRLRQLLRLGALAKDVVPDLVGVS